MLMSKSEYARHRGVSRQTVYDWVAKGGVVLSGNKIDVEATQSKMQNEQKDQGEEHNPLTLKMTWGQFWATVKGLDGKTTFPHSDEEIRKRVELAAGELGWSVEFLDAGGIYMCDGDADYYVIQYEPIQNARVAIWIIRRDLCYTACERPDDEGEWSKEGLAALAEWKTDNL
ncbi:TPA: hypothetical protein M4Y83_002863 [Klebsiella pneumoniae]|nr:hypothetical protein [Klebsiella pneumoniae]HDK6056435.1 hypothetical protein [Klebsiella pneumoniae]